MNLTDAARATRNYSWLWCGVARGFICIKDNRDLYARGYTVHKTEDEAQAACDRLNLLAVLEAIRGPMKQQIDTFGIARGLWTAEAVANVVIDALIAEVKNCA